jgi:hypothetical protein
VNYVAGFHEVVRVIDIQQFIRFADANGDGLADERFRTAVTLESRKLRHVRARPKDGIALGAVAISCVDDGTSGVSSESLQKSLQRVRRQQRHIAGNDRETIDFGSEHGNASRDGGAHSLSIISAAYDLHAKPLQDFQERGVILAGNDERLIEAGGTDGGERVGEGGRALEIGEQLVAGTEAARVAGSENERCDLHQQQAPLVPFGSSTAVNGMEVPQPGKMP